MTDSTFTPTTGNSRLGQRTLTSASSRLRRSRKDINPFSTENSRQNTKDIELHDVPDEELREKGKQKLERPAVMQKMYEKSCNRYKVVPVRLYWEAPDSHVICLPNYNLGPLGVQAMSVPLMLHDSITRLDLSGNDMGVNGVRALVEALKGNTSITDMNLSDNKLLTAGAYALKEFLREHPGLQTLSLSGNGFKDEDSVIFGQVMKDNQRLKHVNFSHNEFAETAGLQFRYVMSDTDNLETFDISWNHLRRKGAMDLLAGVKKNFGLRVLDVSFNGFAAEGAAVMANVLKKNRTLQEVDMRHNRLNDKDVINIATKMDSNDSLKVLKLGDNNFTQIGALALLTVLLNPDNVVALELLDLGNICVNEEFDFIANELKTSRQKLAIRYGRVITVKKKALKKIIADENITCKDKQENFNKIERATTSPNMTHVNGRDINELEFASVLDFTQSDIGKRHSNDNFINEHKEDIIEPNIFESLSGTMNEDKFKKTNGTSISDENRRILAKANVFNKEISSSEEIEHRLQIGTESNVEIKKLNTELSIQKMDLTKNSTDAMSKYKQGMVDTEKREISTKSNTSLDPRNLFVLQRESFIEKKSSDKML